MLYSLYEDWSNSLWNELATFYRKADRKEFQPGKSSIEMVFFWKGNDSKQYDYFNAVRVNTSDQGIAFLPALNHLAMKPVLIPWSDLSIESSRRLWIASRLVLRCADTDVRVTVRKKWVSEIELHTKNTGRIAEMVST